MSMTRPRDARTLRVSTERDGSLKIDWQKPFGEIFAHKHFIFEDSSGRQVILEATNSNHVTSIAFVGFSPDQLFNDATFNEIGTIKIPYGAEG